MRSFNNNPYFEKLKDPRWQKKRLEIMERDLFSCQNCFETTKTLNVHHKYYEKGRDIWDYPDESLVTLCEECHQIATDYKQIQLKELTIQVSKHFLPNHIGTIAYGFEKLKVNHLDDVVASAIAYTLSTPKMMDLILREYLNFLRNVNPEAIDFIRERNGEKK